MLRKMLVTAGVAIAATTGVAGPAAAEEVCAGLAVFAPPPARETTREHCEPSPFVTSERFYCTGAPETQVALCVEVTGP